MFSLLHDDFYEAKRNKRKKSLLFSTRLSRFFFFLLLLLKEKDLSADALGMSKDAAVFLCEKPLCGAGVSQWNDTHTNIHTKAQSFFLLLFSLHCLEA